MKTGTLICILAFCALPAVAQPRRAIERTEDFRRNPALRICGGAGQSCCADTGPLRMPHCGAGLGCDTATNTCVTACGGNGQACCDGPDTYAPTGDRSPTSPFYCTSGFDSCVPRKQMCATGSCNPSSHQCNDCGRVAGGACCPPDAQQATASCKDPGLICQSGNLSAPGGACVTCGQQNGPACAGQRCAAGLVADNNVCRPCGAIGQPACETGCREGEENVSGQCVVDVCRVYAGEAVQQNAENIRKQCGYSGDRWTANEAGHYAWCKSVSKPVADAETQARAADLKACDPHVIETMTDRCSGDVIIAAHYNDDFATAQRDGVFLKRGGVNFQAASTLRIEGHTWIRWFCHSTTGNWADPGTWRLNSGSVSVGCTVDPDTGDVSNCKPINGDISAAVGNANDWTAERSRCASSNTRYIDGSLGTNRLLRIRCWGR